MIVHPTVLARMLRYPVDVLYSDRPGLVGTAREDGMKDGDRVRIIKHITLHGMSLRGREGVVKDVGGVYATVEIVTTEWFVRVPIDALEVLP